MASKLPEPHELPALLTNVSYEVEVLAWSLRRAADLYDKAEVARIYSAAIDRSAYVNAALVAARNLFYFFEDTAWRKGAPKASDYVPAWVPMPGGAAAEVANHQVVHIGLNRVRRPLPTDLDALADEINLRLGVFYAALDGSLQPRAHDSLAGAIDAVMEPGKRR